MRTALLLGLATLAAAADRPDWSLTAGATFTRPENVVRDAGFSLTPSTTPSGGAVETDPDWALAPEIGIAWRGPGMTFRLRAWWFSADEDVALGGSGVDAYPATFVNGGSAVRAEAASEVDAGTLDLTAGSPLAMGAGPSFAPEGGLRLLLLRTDQRLVVDDTTDYAQDERVRSFGVGPLLAVSGRWGFGEEGRFGLQARLSTALLRTAVDIDRSLVFDGGIRYARSDDETRLATTVGFRLGVDARLGQGWGVQAGWSFARWGDVGDRQTHVTDAGAVEGAGSPVWESFDLAATVVF